MKLVSPKQKISTTGSSERINFSNEIENIYIEDTSIRFSLSDFNSDIIRFCLNDDIGQVFLLFICDRPGRKYTFILLNNTLHANIYIMFQCKGETFIFSNEAENVFKAGTSGIIDLYQTSNSEVHLVQHTLNPH